MYGGTYTLDDLARDTGICKCRHPHELHLSDRGLSPAEDAKFHIPSNGCVVCKCKCFRRRSNLKFWPVHQRNGGA